jgi:sarcosine oxidase, subunit beta
MRLECRKGGVAIRTGSEVTEIRRRGEGFGINLGGDGIETAWVVDAAGPYARRVAALAGVDVPIEPVRRNLAYVRSDDEPPGLIPMCIDVETGVLVRKEVGGGYLLAYSNPNDPPGWDTSVDPRFLEELAARVGNRFPALRDVPIDARHCWAGLYPETPDHQAIVGVAPENERFVLCAGFGGHGLMHAPAAGRAVAEIVTTGRCTSFDIRPFRPSRFAEGDLSVETAVL